MIRIARSVQILGMVLLNHAARETGGLPIPFGSGDQPFQPIRFGESVGVEKQEIISLATREHDIVPSRESEVGVVFNYGDAGIAIKRQTKVGEAIISRSIVGNIDIGHNGRLQQRVHALCK